MIKTNKKGDQMFFSLKDFDFRNKKVVLRVDFNVPIDEKGNITNNKRIKATLQTINYLIAKKAKIILISHLGRPNGKIIEKLRMKNIGKELSKLINKKILVANNCISENIKELVNSSKEQIILLENLRFYKQEELNDLIFAKKLASLGDIYVNDAFSVSHRAHASVNVITRFLPSCAGFLLEKEINALSKILKNPKKPFVAIMGGAKVSDKINVIKNLLKNVDALLIGGAMAFTFYKSTGIKVGKSIVENNKLSLAKNLIKKSNNKIILPTDIVVAKSKNSKKIKTVNYDLIPNNMLGFDIGQATINFYKFILKDAKTIFWNGPLGLFEVKQFSKSTFEIAKFLANMKKSSIIIGGGDTVAAIEKLKLENEFTYISTGGGASLEFLEGRKLPGIKALEKNYQRFRKQF